MAAPYVEESLPPPLDSTSDPPPLFDGTTRLYVNYNCPYVQRVWIVRNYKGLQDEIKLVPIDLQNRPDWYKEKVYPRNQVPSLEHNGKIIGESLDLVKYVDANFKGPSLLPDDSDKQKFAEELFAYSGTFQNNLYAAYRGGDTVKQAGTEFDHLETALHKFEDGPFFLGHFSQVDAVYAPFIERSHAFLSSVWKYDITSGRPKLAKWIEEINKIDAYKATKVDPQHVVEAYKKRFLWQTSNKERALSVQEVRPPLLNSTCLEPPPLFDGTTRNYKGLQDQIKIVGIDLSDKPAWYKEKVYPENKLPALEHNAKIIGESLDLIRYVDTNFEGPSLLPDDPAKLKFADEMIAYLDTILKNVFSSFKGDPAKEAGGEFDYLEYSLQKFEDGPFFLGQFSQVDAAYAPFIERFQIFLQEVFKYDITAGRPRLAAYIEELNKIDAYKQTKCDPNWLLQFYRSRFMST